MSIPRKLAHADRVKDDAEVLDKTPMETTLVRPLTLREEMQRYIRYELSRQAEDMGLPSFEEEDDFDEEEPEPDMVSPYELHDMYEDAPPDALPATLDGKPSEEDQKALQEDKTPEVTPDQPSGPAAA